MTVGFTCPHCGNTTFQMVGEFWREMYCIEFKIVCDNCSEAVGQIRSTALDEFDYLKKNAPKVARNDDDGIPF